MRHPSAILVVILTGNSCLTFRVGLTRGATWGQDEAVVYSPAPSTSYQRCGWNSAMDRVRIAGNNLKCKKVAC
jgi:hypothetical protein